jgi:hypothetical protein
MPRQPTQAAQDEAYTQGFDADHTVDYANPYDSDKVWLLFMAYEQGWNDGRDHAARLAAKREDFSCGGFFDL